ncbi:tRNA (guanine-N(7)-)-methyltransferase (tRNA(m7G46)-methyltransferase) [Collariella sp. IMI 366227]|nr:tRNA (guanine-N(7)-)-methyltransferase (tRNA(m7G46)-methyltransferase) [Collariella sp. IMI 366227]
MFQAPLAGVACFGYAVNCIPTLRWTVRVFIGGVLLTLAALAALVVLTSRGPQHRQLRRTARPKAAAFLAPQTWKTEVAALRQRQTYTKTPLCPESPKLSAALDELLEFIIRDFISAWYSSISKNPVFTDEVDKAIRGALLRVCDRIQGLDLAEILTTRLVPLMTAHFRDFSAAERSVRGRKLNRSMTETEELDLAIASKYKEGKLHPAASLAFSDTKTAQQDYLRQAMSKILPRVLPEDILASRAVSTLIREITACAVMFPIMQILSDPDTWNQIMENYGRTMLQDRSTVRRLRAALDQHASPAPKTSKPVAFPRLTPADSERRFEKFIRAIRKLNNLSDARRFRSEVASQLKRDSQQENVDQVYLRRLEMGKRLLDQRVQHLAAGGRRPPPPSTEAVTPSESRLENASLAELLRDPSALSYFMEYMDRQRLMPMVQFWLVVDGFRNPLEDDGPEGEQLPLQLPPWTDSDRMDLAQIDAAYLRRSEPKVPDSSKRTIQEFLKAGKRATPEQYYRARREILRAQSAVLEEMRAKHFQNFKKSDLFFKALAAEEASKRTAMSTPIPRTGSPLPRSASHNPSKPSPVTRLAPRLHPGPITRRTGSASDLKAMNVNGNNGLDPLSASRLSIDEPHSPTPLFDDEDVGEDALADSVASLDQDTTATPPVPDTKVVQAMEKALNNILEESQPPTAEEIRASLFGDDDSGSAIFTPDGEAKKGGSPADPPRLKRVSADLTKPDGKSLDVPKPEKAPSSRGSFDNSRPGDLFRSSKASLDVDRAGKGPEKPSLASLGLVSAASRIGVFVDDDLFGDEGRFLSDNPSDFDGDRDEDDEDAVHEAAPGDLGLAEAITALSNDIDKLIAQEAVVDSLLKKAELTNNTAELRILRKSKASLQREIRRKELQRQQYVLQESDNSLYGRSTIKIKSIQVGRDEEGKEFAVYAIEVSRNAGERMPAATWVVTRRYSEFLELHQNLRPEDTTAQKQKDMITRLYDSVADGMEDILGSIPVLDQLSLAGQNLIAAATNQLNATPLPLPGPGDDTTVGIVNTSEAEAELAAFEDNLIAKESEPFVKPICDIFLEVFELHRGNNWLRGRAVVVVLHQLLGGTIERKLRENVRGLVQEEALLRIEAGLMLATLVPDLAGSVVGRLNAQAASRRVFAAFNNARLNAHLAFTLLDEVVRILFED